MQNLRCYLFAILLAIPCILYAQPVQSAIPYAVKIQFMDDYISASDVVWKQLRDQYVVNFIHQSHIKTATYSANGTLLFTETKLNSLKQVPATIARSLSKRFKNYTIEEIVKVEQSGNFMFKFRIRKKRTEYEIEYSKKCIDHELQYSASGKLSRNTKLTS